MGSMCSNCFTGDYRKYHAGLVCKHCKGKIVEIDDNILPTIIILNKKGYMTSYCCGGHAYNHQLTPPQIYITFSGKPESIPSEFQYESWDTSCKTVSHIHKFLNEHYSSEQLQEVILNDNLTLLKWAQSLSLRKEQE